MKQPECCICVSNCSIVISVGGLDTIQMMSLPNRKVVVQKELIINKQETWLGLNILPKIRYLQASWIQQRCLQKRFLCSIQWDLCGFLFIMKTHDIRISWQSRRTYMFKIHKINPLHWTSVIVYIWMVRKTDNISPIYSILKIDNLLQVLG